MCSTDNRQSIGFWLALVVLSAIALYMQYVVPINPDVSWLAEAANRFLHGGSYYQNFFEANPPMIIYFYLLPTWVSNTFGVNRTLALDAFTFLIAFSILTYLYYLSRFYWEKKSTRQIFILIMLIAILICPARAFSQRSYYALILILPYIFQTALLEVNHVLKKHHRVLIAILAGIAVSFKPYYLLAPLFIEAYLMWKKQCWTHWFRLETVIIAAVLVLYLATIPLIAPTYFSQVFPFASHYYLIVAKQPTILMFMNYATIFVAMTLILWILYHQQQKDRLTNLLLYIGAAFFISYYIQGEIWYYHLYPLVAVSTIILLWLMYKSLRQRKYLLLSYGLLTAAVGIMLFLQGEVFSTINEVYASQSTYHTLIEYSKKHAAGKHVYCFDASTLCTSYLIQHADVKTSSRFASFWMAPGMIIKQHQKLDSKQLQQLKNNEKELRQMVVEDFEKQPPKLVIVLKTQHPFYFGPYTINYLKFFSKNPEFKKIWRQYQYQTKIGYFSIYQRMKTK